MITSSVILIQRCIIVNYNLSCKFEIVICKFFYVIFDMFILIPITCLILLALNANPRMHIPMVH